MKKSPSKQVRRNAANLKHYLDLHNLDVGWVEPIVVWAGTGELVVQNPAVPVWTLNALPEQVEALWQTSKLSTEDVAQITGVLDELFEEIKAKPPQKENNG